MSDKGGSREGAKIKPLLVLAAKAVAQLDRDIVNSEVPAECMAMVNKQKIKAVMEGKYKTARLQKDVDAGFGALTKWVGSWEKRLSDGAELADQLNRIYAKVDTYRGSVITGDDVGMALGEEVKTTFNTLYSAFQALKKKVANPKAKYAKYSKTLAADIAFFERYDGKDLPETCIKALKKVKKVVDDLAKLIDKTEKAMMFRASF
ncbi:MAG: hypothetical protein AAGC57_00230 [Pseudomonadota bacterium]